MLWSQQSYLPSWFLLSMRPMCHHPHHLQRHMQLTGRMPRSTRIKVILRVTCIPAHCEGLAVEVTVPYHCLASSLLVISQMSMVLGAAGRS
jgi:hypothetical protein